jgi:hypothetical protein
MSSPAPSSSFIGAPSSATDGNAPTTDGNAPTTPNKRKRNRIPASASAKLSRKNPKRRRLSDDPAIIFDRRGRLVADRLPPSLRSMGFQHAAETVRNSGTGPIGSIVGLDSDELGSNLEFLQQTDRKQISEALIIEQDLYVACVEYSSCTAKVQEHTSVLLHQQNFLKTLTDKQRRLEKSRTILLEQKTKFDDLRHLVQAFLGAHAIIAENPLQNATHAEARAYVSVETYQDILNLSKTGVIKKLWTLNNAGFARSQVFRASWVDCPDPLLTYFGKDPHSMEEPSIRRGNESLVFLQPRLALYLGIQPPANALHFDDSDSELERLPGPIQEETDDAELPDEDPTSGLTTAQLLAALARRCHS